MKMSEAITTMMEGDKKGFKQSIELVINLQGITLSDPKNRIEEMLQLPAGRGKPAKIAMFASDPELVRRGSGVVDRVIASGDIEALTIKQVKRIAHNYDFFLAEAPLMPMIGKRWGIALGPRGKMPRPIPPTADPGPITQQLRDSVRIRLKGQPVMHVLIGSEEMQPEEIEENLKAAIERIGNLLEKGKQAMSSAYIKKTMGSPVRVI